LTYEVEVDELGRPLNVEMENPGYVGKGTSTDGTMRRGRIESPLKERSDMGGGTRDIGYDGGRRRSAPTVRDRQPTRRRMPPTRVGRGEDGYGAQEEVLVEKRRLDPDKLSFQEVEMLILDLQELPSVYELHEIGYIVETLAKTNPRERPFGDEASFERTPPWALDRCVEAAVAWLDKNRAEFPNAPAPATDAAREAAKETAAPVKKEAPEA